MPAIGLIPLIALAATAVSTGVGVYESVQQGDQAKEAEKLAREAAAQQQLTQKREALTAAGPNAQAQTGGSLTGPAGQSFIDILAGLPGTTGGGSTNPTSSSAASASNTTNSSYAPPANPLAEFMEQQQPFGGFSGGWQPPQPTSPNRFQLSDFLG